jgi:hypothetical protein
MMADYASQHIGKLGILSAGTIAGLCLKIGFDTFFISQVYPQIVVKTIPAFDFD